MPRTQGISTYLPEWINDIGSPRELYTQMNIQPKRIVSTCMAKRHDNMIAWHIIYIYLMWTS